MNNSSKKPKIRSLRLCTNMEPKTLTAAVNVKRHFVRVLAAENLTMMTMMYLVLIGLIRD